MKIEIKTEGTQLKGVTFSHVDNRQEQESVERILANVFKGENPLVALELEQEQKEQDVSEPVDDICYFEPIEIEADETTETVVVETQSAYDAQLTRAFLVGYYVDENGLATDKAGNSLGEKIPGQFLREFKNRLVLYDYFDEDGGAYLPASTGDHVYYDDDEKILALIREEIHRCQPINSLFAVLTGMPTVNIFKNVATGINWKNYVHPVGKAILETRDIGQTFYCDPLYVQPIMSHKIRDYEDWSRLAIETLTRQVGYSIPASAYLLSVSDIEVLAEILNPQNWKTIFRRGDFLKTVEELLVPAGKKARLILNAAYKSPSKILGAATWRNNNYAKLDAWQKLKDVLDSWDNFAAEYPSLQ